MCSTEGVFCRMTLVECSWLEIWCQNTEDQGYSIMTAKEAFELCLSGRHDGKVEASKGSEQALSDKAPGRNEGEPELGGKYSRLGR